MKFSGIPAFSALFAVASASYTTDVALVCTADPTTVTQTVTVTAAPYSGGGNTYTPSNLPPDVTTNGGFVTSVDYSGSLTSVWVYPTGSSSHDCTVAIYEKTTIINVIVVNINVSIVNNVTTTITSTVSGAYPTWTPPPPPPYHSFNMTSTRSSSHTSSMRLSTGVYTQSKNGTYSTTKPTSSMTLHTRPLSTGESSSSKNATSSVSVSQPYGTGNMSTPTGKTTPSAKFSGSGIPPMPTASSSIVLPRGRRANAWYA